MCPIKGLSEKRRLPRIGKLHLGVRVKREDGVEYPRAVDYFVYPPDHPQLKELIVTYGEKPKELRIIIPVEDEEKFASQYYRLYSRTRGLVCKGDGETAVRMIDTATGALANRESKEVELKEVPCQGKDCVDYGSRGCGEVMNLQFLLPEVSGFGVWQIDTGSINSIMNVNSALELVRQVYGRVSMVPLILALEPKEVVNPDDGKKKTVRVLNIRSQDKMIEAYRKASMAPLALVQGMTENGEFSQAEAVELPPAGDTAPFIDLPVVKEASSQADKDFAKLGEGKPAKSQAKATKPVPKTEPETQEGKQEPAKPLIDLDWLKENMTKVKFTEKTVISWMKSKANYHGLDFSGSFSDIVSRMNREQAEFLEKEIKSRLEMI